MLRFIVSFPLNQTRALEKQQRDTLLSDRLQIEELGIYFAKEPRRPQGTSSFVYIEVINFCGPQPCSPSREQRYYGLFELEPRTSVRNIFQNSTKSHKDFAVSLKKSYMRSNHDLALVYCHTCAINNCN